MLNHFIYWSFTSICRNAELKLIYKYNEIVVYYDHFDETFCYKTSNVDDQLEYFVLYKTTCKASLSLVAIKCSYRDS